MKMRKVNVKVGKKWSAWFSAPQFEACCDCGLVHAVAYKWARNTLYKRVHRAKGPTKQLRSAKRHRCQ